MKFKKYLLLCFSGLMLLSACNDFLDVKSDKSLAVPESAADFRRLLDNTTRMTDAYPVSTELAADNFYLSYPDWLNSRVTERNSYIWEKDVFNDHASNDWSVPYTAVFYANVVLDGIKDIKDGTNDLPEWDLLKGDALFYRANAFHQLAQVFAPAFDVTGTNNEPGIVLRLSSDLGEKLSRATVADTYQRILADTKQAATLLSLSPLYKTRPSKPAAFALLARTYLSMADYENAGKYADSCLSLYSGLMDYNKLDLSAANPIPQANEEVIFQSSFWNTGILGPATAKVDTLLYSLYEPDDLRKEIFFRKNADGKTFSFRGNYSGAYVLLFNGLATDEMWLIRAECNARAGRAAKAAEDVNRLLEKRYRTGTYSPLISTDADVVLNIILQERRKELAFRGIRWSDLQRLNKEPRFATVLTRKLNGQTYSLPPGDKRYVFQIPINVVSSGDIGQNP